MSGNDYRKERTDYVLHETSWLFQRFNYFLVGIAFLVTALAAIVALQHFALDDGSGYLAWFALALCAVGYSLPSFFAVVNHLASVKIRLLQKSLSEEPKTPLFEWAPKIWSGELPKDRHLLNDILRVIRDHSPENEYQVAPHTYLVPLGFWLFWLFLALSLLFAPNVEYRRLYWVTFAYLAIIPLLVYRRVYHSPPWSAEAPQREFAEA